jgi:hypothetical protein
MWKLLMKWMMPSICAIVGVTALGSDLRAQGVRVLSSDLAATAICNDRDPITLEDPFERFLSGQGFKVLNVARVQREHGHRPLLEVQMVGLDDKRRMINFRMLPYPKDQNTTTGPIFSWVQDHSAYAPRIRIRGCVAQFLFK